MRRHIGKGLNVGLRQVWDAFEARCERDFEEWGTTEDSLFIGEMNCRSESDQIRNWFGLFVQFSSGGKQLAASVPHIFFPVCFPLVWFRCGHDRVRYVKFEFVIVLILPSVVDPVLSDGPNPRQKPLLEIANTFLVPPPPSGIISPLMHGTVRLIPIISYGTFISPLFVHRVYAIPQKFGIV